LRRAEQRARRQFVDFGEIVLCMTVGRRPAMEPETEHETPTLADVRLAILRQHTQLAQLLDELETQAAGVVNGDDCVACLNDALVLIHRRFLRSLEFEETRLPPLLSVLAQECSAGLRESLADHVDQRARIEGLIHDRVVFTDPKTLAREALAFVHRVRVDMVEEDAGLRALG
jgi:hypothetical protein